MPRPRLAPAVLLALLIMILAACSSGGSSTTASPTAAASSAEASESADSSESEAAMPSIDLPNSAPELEALIPDEVGGVALQKFSMAGPEFMAQGEDNQEFVDFLDRLGAEPDDVSVAFGFGFDATGDSGGAGVFAFKVAGADTDQLLDEMQTSLEEEESATGFEDASVGGKDVRRGTSTDDTGNVYLYGVGDIVFFVATPDEDAAAEVLADLP